MSVSISRDEWLRALADVGFIEGENDEHAVTVAEFGQLIGLERTAATKRLRALVAAGKATETYKRVQAQSGQVVRCRAYRLIDAPKEPKAKRKCA